MLQALGNVVSAVILSFSVLCLIYAIIEKNVQERSRKTDLLAYSVLLLCCLTLVFLDITFIFKVMIVLFLFMIVLRFIFKQRWLFSLISAVLIYALIGVVDTAVILTFVMVMPKSGAISQSVTFPFSNTIVSVIVFFVSVFIRKNGLFMVNSNLQSKSKLLWIFYVITIFLLIVFNCSAILNGSSNKSIVISNVIGLIVFALSNILLGKMLKENYNNEKQILKKQQDLENLMVYTNHIESLTDELRIFKHRYNNIMLTISGYLNDNDIEGLNNCMRDVIRKSQAKNDNKNFSELKKIKDSGIKSLLIDKIIKIENTRKISAEIFINKEIRNFYIDTFDMVNILGILTDNAIEESMKVDDPKIIINIIDTNEYIVFSIANKFKDKPDISRIFKKGFSTKGVNRGIGLYDLQKIINESQNLMLNTKITDDGYFFQEIKIRKS